MLAKGSLVYVLVCCHCVFLVTFCLSLHHITRVNPPYLLPLSFLHRNSQTSFQQTCALVSSHSLFTKCDWMLSTYTCANPETPRVGFWGGVCETVYVSVCVMLRAGDRRYGGRCIHKDSFDEDAFMKNHFRQMHFKMRFISWRCIYEFISRRCIYEDAFHFMKTHVWRCIPSHGDVFSFMETYFWRCISWRFIMHCCQ